MEGGSKVQTMSRGKKIVDSEENVRALLDESEIWARLP